MGTSPSSGPGVPEIDLVLNGRSAPAALLMYVEAVEVADSVDLPSMFSFVVSSSDAQNPPAPWADDGTMFAIGTVVEIKMGYATGMDSLIEGEITALEPEFTSSRLPVLKVRGYNRLHRLQRGRKTRTFVQKKDSDIASQIGEEAGLAVKTEDSGTTYDYILQANRTDWEFLRERAHRIRYELAATGKTLFFRPVGNDQGAALTLSMDDTLIGFYPRLSSSGQATSVNVRGWSVANKQAILGTAAEGDEVSGMGGQANAATVARKAFGTAVEVIGDWPVEIQAEADQWAKARFNELALTFIDGEGVSWGRTDLRAGKVVEIDGIGSRFAGPYYITEAVHRYSPGRDYLTHFTVRRSAS